MTKALVIPYFNSLAQTKVCWGINCYNSFLNEFDQIILIDNGDTDHTTEWLRKYILPNTIGDVHLVTNKENVGVLASLQQGYEKVNKDTDVIVYMHNDVAILEYIYSPAIIEDMFNHSDTGICGLFGAKIAGIDGGRGECVYNGLEAPLEGDKIYKAKEVTLLDGLFLAIRKKILDNTNGWDMNYTYHHFYDKDISLESIKQGYKNYVLPISYYHLSGQTANFGSYKQWIGDKLEGGDIESHKLSEEYYLAKWKDFLPYKVE